jgi:hypothetical protein
MPSSSAGRAATDPEFASLCVDRAAAAAAGGGAGVLAYSARHNATLRAFPAAAAAGAPPAYADRESAQRLEEEQASARMRSTALRARALAAREIRRGAWCSAHARSTRIVIIIR